MLKQQTVPTSLGQLTVSSLTLGELRQLDALFQEKSAAESSGLSSLLRYLPVIQNAVRKVHQDLTAEQLENGRSFDDFNVLFNAMLEVSGLKKAPRGNRLRYRYSRLAVCLWPRRHRYRMDAA